MDTVVNTKENPMKEQRKDELTHELKKLKGELKKIGPVMRGSVTIMGTKNKQPYFSVSMGGKTKNVYLGDKRAAKAKKYVENYKAMMSITDKMTLVQMELMKLEGTQ
jgi:hypothetical protein